MNDYYLDTEMNPEMNKKSFFQIIIKPRLLPLLNDMSILHFYCNVQINHERIENYFEKKEGFNYKEFNLVYFYYRAILEQLFELKIIDINLFKDTYSANNFIKIHDKYGYLEYSNHYLNNEFMEKVNTIKSNTIVDVLKVGMEAPGYLEKQKALVRVY